MTALSSAAEAPNVGMFDTFLTELRELVGGRWVHTDPCVLDSYAWHMNAEIMVGGRFMPRAIAVVLPKNTEEVAAIVKLCLQHRVQYKATATGQGPWNAPKTENNSIQIDLRRLDRIVSIDEKNMHAVVEPYVTNNQLQTECMKLGLNCHIIGAGGQSSQLAAATSFNGQGPDGISCGFAGRNLLGFEWVTPEGDIVQAGSFDSSGSMFLGDGPGPSLRGVIRGFAGAMSGLGVFTKAAVKLYPWEGPKRLHVEGQSPYYHTHIPENHLNGTLGVPNWSAMADLGYDLGEAEIASHCLRNAPALTIPALFPDRNLAASGYQIPLLNAFNHNLYTVFTGAHPEEARYKQKAIEEMSAALGGGFLGNDPGLSGLRNKIRFLRLYTRRIGGLNMLRSIPGLLLFVVREVRQHGLGILRGGNPLDSVLYGKLVRADANVRAAIALGGVFATSMGAVAPWDVSVRSAQAGIKVKKRFIARDEILDDGGDGGHGGLYEGGGFSHIETVAQYDPNDPRQADAIGRFVAQTNQAAIDKQCGIAINSFGPEGAHAFSPHAMGYDRLIQRIKAEFDPHDSADAGWYTDPAFEPSPEQTAALEEAKTLEIDDSTFERSARLGTPTVPRKWLEKRGYDRL
jgi:glycolate oxidase